MVAASAPLRFSGVAHPPPGRGGIGDGSDLNAAEIGMLSKGALNGRPILREHTGSAVGKCLTSWQSRDGSLCIEANVDDESVKKEIRTGKLRGLSLGTDCLHIDEGNVHKDQREISVCEEGRRSQTWIFEINGKRRHRFQPASKTASGVWSPLAARRPPPAARRPPSHAIPPPRSAGTILAIGARRHSAAYGRVTRVAATRGRTHRNNE